MIRPTTIINAPTLATQVGLKQLLLASETSQHTGSFKFRAAYNLVSKVPQKLILTASSGNFGQAVAYACKLLEKRCIVVMPATSARTKVAAVKEHGGTVELIDVKAISRAERVTQLARQFPEAYVASAYDDPLVIEGNATLGKELAAIAVDHILAPVGGGGLTSGIITGLRAVGSKVSVIGVEPLLANDAARSFRAGKLVSNESEPATIADGVRTVSLGKRNWEILKEGLSRIIEVSEDSITKAMRMLFELAKLKTEPTGALSVAGVLTESHRFKDNSVCCVISGGNVDPEVFEEIVELNPSP